MNKVEAPRRPAASLKFTIDSILNLKTSGSNCDTCHSAGAQDELATTMRKDNFLHEEKRTQPRQDPDGLNESGKRFEHIYSYPLSSALIITHSSRTSVVLGLRDSRVGAVTTVG